MSSITTRSGKGSTLTWAEMDANLTNLNNDKLEASTVHSAISKATPVAADEMMLVDSASSYTLKKLLWSNLLAGIWNEFGALINGGTSKTTPVDADSIPIQDSAASNATKQVLWSNIKATLKVYFDTLYGSLSYANSWTKAQRSTTSALTDGATITPDFSLSNSFIVQLGGNRTLAIPTNLAANQSGTITVLQDKTGSRTLSYDWPYVWPNAASGTLSTPGGTEDQLIYEVRSYNSAAVTISIAAPGIVTMNSHGFYHGQRVRLTTTGALPTGLSTGVTYFVEVIDSNSFYLCTSLVNVASGTRITTSGSQSGVHTLVGCTIRLSLNKAYA